MENKKVIALEALEGEEQVYRFPTYAPLLDAEGNSILGQDGNPIQEMVSYVDYTISQMNGDVGSCQATIDDRTSKLAMVAALADTNTP